VARFEEHLDRYLKEPDQAILLDLRRVEYIDSAGLRYLLALRDRLAECRDRIILVVKRESRVERTLCLVGFDKMFEMVRKPFGVLRGKRGE
jgi:anti-anti-sigma factor